MTAMTIQGDPTTCGIFHIFGFYNSPATPIRVSHWHPQYVLSKPSTLPAGEIFEAAVAKVRSYGGTYESRTKMASCVLTDAEINNGPEWPALLKKNGFRLVSRFKNTGGAWNNVFHAYMNPKAEGEIPAWWKELD